MGLDSMFQETRDMRERMGRFGMHRPHLAEGGPVSSLL